MTRICMTYKKKNRNIYERIVCVLQAYNAVQSAVCLTRSSRIKTLLFSKYISVLKLVYVLTSPEHCCDLYGNVYWR